MALHEVKVLQGHSEHRRTGDTFRIFEDEVRAANQRGMNLSIGTPCTANW